jgi:2-haloacid dehalogenase
MAAPVTTEPDQQAGLGWAANIKTLMFDQYGTLVDMQGGLIEVAKPYLASKGWTGSANSFVTWWRRTHYENSMIDALLQKQHIAYRDIGHLSVTQVLRRAGIEHTRAEVEMLVEAIVRLKPFPEIPAALDRLRTKYKVAVLSNGDPDMLEAAKAHHGLVYDHTISVREANAFKPHVATYTKAAEIIGLRMDEILFVANHEFDCVGAKAAGMRAAFIDRRQRPFADWPYQPDVIVRDMTALANLLMGPG